MIAPFPMKYFKLLILLSGPPIYFGKLKFPLLNLCREKITPIFQGLGPGGLRGDGRYRPFLIFNLGDRSSYYIEF